MLLSSSSTFHDSWLLEAELWKTIVGWEIHFSSKEQWSGFHANQNLTVIGRNIQKRKKGKRESYNQSSGKTV